MKKLLFGIGFLTILLFPSICGSLDYLNSGEYVYYLDTRGGKSFFRGYLFFTLDTGDYVVFCRNLNLNDNKQANYMFQLGDRNGELTVTKTEGLSDSIPPEYQQGLIDFLNHNSMYQNIKNDIRFGSFIEDPWEDYTLLYYYNRVLPFFRFLDITLKGDSESSYELNTAGIITIDNVKDFFSITPVQLNEKQRNPNNLKIPVKKHNKVSINGLSTELDDNWVFNDQIGSPGYWLNFNSHRDSQITVEVIPDNILTEKKLTHEEICRLSIISSPKVNYRSITGYSNQGLLYVSYSSLDNNDIKNYQFYIVKNNRQIINFSTFADVFDANNDYYKNIINKIIK